jgi:hypothetical protein
MTTWTSSNPCPACGRTGQKGVRCTNCQTVGCDNGNCTHGGTKATCAVCHGQHTKQRM